MAQLSYDESKIRKLDNAQSSLFELGGAGAVGLACYIDTDGKVQLTVADGVAAATAEIRGLIVAIAPNAGVVRYSGVSGDYVEVVTDGDVGGFSSLTEGAVAYVAEDALGKLETAAPASGGEIVKVAGYAKASDVFTVRPATAAGSSV